MKTGTVSALGVTALEPAAGEMVCAPWEDGGNRTLSRHSPVGDQDSGGNGGDMDKRFWIYKDIYIL